MLNRFLAGLLGIVLFACPAISGADHESSPMEHEFTVGDAVPDFVLKNQAFEDVTLSSFHGRQVILAFYVFAFTGG